MTAPPFPAVYEGDGLFRALPRFKDLCAENFGQGEVVVLGQIEERSEASHRQEFAWLREAWTNLPEHLSSEYGSPEALRKRALIMTGWCNIRDYACASKAEARRLAATLRGELDEYTVVDLRDDVVRVCRAKSQARNKMKKADWEASKRDILNWVARLLEVTPDQLQKAQAA